ncbi:MAG: carboxypeptidase-like regulatory domain-containing protein [Acidobacteriota bacterium]|nr:carboxypeptidase-like regulatory domain-containing protein [Acidobacteriota bacterium]
MKVLQILVLIFGLVVFANAQTKERTVLTGTVYDVNGAVIPRMSVVFVNQKGERFETTTDENGGYWYYLPVSKYETISNAGGSDVSAILNEYEITFSNPNSGFRQFVIKNFILAGKMQLDVALAPRANLEPGIADGILQRQLKKLPQEQNKSKRKKKNNKR